MPDSDIVKCPSGPRIRALTSGNIPRWAFSAMGISATACVTIDMKIDQSIADLFWSNVNAFPNAPAVVTREETWSYADLGRITESVAAAIVAADPIGPDLEESESDGSFIGLLLPHDARLISGMMAPLLVGRGYMPLDPHAPAERLEGMVKISGARVVLTCRELLSLAGQVVGDSVVILCWEDVVTNGSAKKPECIVNENSLAYLLFTSGSTGEPKAIAHSHESLLRSVKCYTEDCDVTSDSRIALIIQASFTPSVFCVFGALLSGAAIAPCDLRATSIHEIGPWAGDLEISHLYLVPTLFRRIVSAVSAVQQGKDRQHNWRYVKWLQLAGEPVIADDFEAFQSAFPDSAAFYNGMGTSEVSCLCRNVLSREERCDQGTVPVGLPYEDVQVVLKDGAGEDAEEGEIVVHSRYSSHGYWRRPRLTEEKFSQSCDDPAVWIYRTGDLGRRLEDGRILHLGRSDGQLKIQGQRVEPAEVAAALRKLDGVQDATVVGQKDDQGVRHLVAYVEATKGHEIDTDRLRQQLAGVLPMAMIPTMLIPVPVLPLTTTGKINFTSLPPAQFTRSEKEASTLSNQTGDMLILTTSELMARALQLEHVKPDDNFFDLGGESLMATELMCLVEQVASAKLSASELVNAATPRLLAQAIRAEINHDAVPGVISLDGQKAKKRSGLGVPVFCIAGLGGFVLCWREVAALLGSDHPCFGLEYPGLDGREAVAESMEEIVSKLAQRVTSCTPEGPIALAGYSFGGVVAFELARHLEDAGREIVLVALADSFSPEYLRPLKFVKGLQGWANFFKDTSILSAAPVFFRRTMERVKFAFDGNAPELFLPFQADEIVEYLEQLTSSRERQVNDANRKAIGSYRSRPFNREVLLFRSTERLAPPRGWLDCYSQWEQLTNNRVRVVDAPGSHFNILRGQGAECIAGTFKEALAGL